MATRPSSAKRPLQVGIFGIGAMGTLFASHLARQCRVTLIGNWPAQIAAIRQHGLELVGLDGSHRQTTPSIIEGAQAKSIPAGISSTGESPTGEFDVALVLAKSWQTESIAPLAKRLLRRDGVAITLQNGLGNVEILARSLGVHRTTQGVTTQGATVLAPGRTRHAGDGPTIIADLPQRRDLLRRLAEALERAHVPVEIRPAAQTDGLVWTKLAANAAINPLTALFEMPNGALLDDPRLTRVMTAAVREVEAVAAAQRIELPADAAIANVVDVARRTASNHSSMWQDVRRGEHSEIDAINGAVVKLGRELRIPTPVNALLYTMVCAKMAGSHRSRQEMLTMLEDGSRDATA